MSGLLFLIAAGVNLLAIAVCATLGCWMMVRSGSERRANLPFVFALGFTGLWSAFAFSLGPLHHITMMSIIPGYLACLWVLHSLFNQDARLEHVRTARLVFYVLASLQLLQVGTISIAPQMVSTAESAVVTVQIALMIQLLFVIGALVLVHNLYIGASAEARQIIRAPAAALAVLWAYDLHIYTLAYLSSSIPLDLISLRSVIILIGALLIGLGHFSSSGKRAVRPSRAVTFQTFSLLLIGVYLLLMIGAAQGLALIGGDFSTLMQVGFVGLMAVLGFVSATSNRLRGWMRVTLSKHLFQHRYDYRNEWLRFNKTIGRTNAEESTLHARVIQVVADITESSAGILLLPSDDGAFKLGSRWRWPSLDVPGEALPELMARKIESNEYILSFEQIRAGADGLFDKSDMPEWLLQNEKAWLLVPLIHFERMIGAVVVAKPQFTRKVDWEDLDLLRIVGQQLASYLAEHSGQEALSEASRFDEFNRRIAFVMHDIKNLASQMSLLARNAEKHADKPEFRADMLVTLRNSADKLNGLLAKLDRYGSARQNEVSEVDLAQLVARVVAIYQGSHPVTIAQSRPCNAMVDQEALEHALGHLIQNGIDASEEGSPIFVNVINDALHARLEVIDNGSGMSPEFIRNGLFKPFHSTKDGGFGIGAFEARETIRAMEGRLDVESREGLGTRFTIRLPLAATEELRGASDDEHINSNTSKVA